ncbi:MAG TPA: hypothetical protein VNZ45_08250 [Bacteroidia bacterium]|nr:hypothetical protein [Bacteroidia bacterium]
MRLSLKKYSSLFLLSIFLFAYTEKGIHDILHSDDAHCHSLTEKHFHPEEHHCVICDFDISTFGPDSLPLQSSFIRHSVDAIFLITENSFSYRVSSLSYTRGPPQVA